LGDGDIETLKRIHRDICANLKEVEKQFNRFTLLDETPIGKEKEEL